ncbi:MAG: hypothetical protein P8O20_08665 [Bacteroidia bacterium]|mgnify:CR=1 FL=1|nr:hypothetical protein [Bacteroidia bacterium]
MPNTKEDIDNYNRKNERANFGTYLGGLAKLNKTNILFSIGQQMQKYSDYSTDEIRSPRKLDFRSYNSKIIFLNLGFEHQLLAAKQWSFAIGINLGVSEFKETSVHIQRNDGSIGDGNLNLQGLNKRVSSSTYMKINYDLERISFFSKVGTQSIIKGLNPEQYSPNTILPNNSKASVLVNFGVGYNFEL